MQKRWFLGLFLAIMCSALVYAAVPGDLDGSGTVDLTDLMHSLQVEAGYSVSVDLTGDTNADGFIGPKDTQYILRKLASPSGTGDVVNFPDINLENAIRDALGIPTGDITEGDLAMLTSLTAENAGISDLTGLEHCTNLTFLDIGTYNSTNRVTDISPLSGLTSLTHLEIISNDVADLSPISGLTSLTHLNFADNRVTSLAPLSGLTSLVTLYFSKNQVTSLAPLAGLSGLTHLDAGKNKLSDISSLTGLTNLIWLNLVANQIEDIAALISNTGLGHGDAVDIAENPLPLNKCLNQIPQLEAKGVTVSYTPCVVVVHFPDPNLEAAVRAAIGKPSGNITDIDLLVLTSLVAEDNGITDLTGMEYCTNLMDLDMGMAGTTNAVFDLSPISGLTSLGNLDLQNNQISDLQNLVNNSGLGAGDTVNVMDNPLNGDACGTQIPTLEGRGVTVENDCPAEVVITITDGNLEAAIRSALGIPTDPITNIDMLNLTSLSAPGAGISDLTGLEHATNLQTLDISGNDVSDLLPLSGLSSLSSLDFRNNKVKDIQPLVDNTDFATGDTVYMEGNLLGSEACGTDGPALAARGVTVNSDCPAEVTVTFTDSDLEAAVRTELGIPAPTPLTTISLLDLYSLTAKNNNIDDLGGLEHCTNLEYLDVGDSPWNSPTNQISDLNPISGLTHLYYLDITSNQVTNITPLTNLISLQTLTIWNNQVSDISALAGLTSLQGLYFYDNQVSDISALAGLTSLQGLGFSSNQVSDISALAGLTSLQSLSFVSNQVSDISALAGLTSLQSLGFSGNQVSDISALAGLTSLQWLFFYNNQVSDISALAGLTSLYSLWFFNNQVSDISALAGLTSLQDLYFYNNQVSDISALVANTGITGTGDTVDIRGNPLDAATSCNTHVPALEARSITLYHDCP